VFTDRMESREAMNGTAKNGVLPEGLVLPGPSVIGATGGSGTRVVARIARTAGV
jgi:hypothetical protein